MDDLHQRVDHNLTNHRPADASIEKIELIRDKAKELGHLIVDLTPQSREQSLALTDLETTVMWAVASIARAPQAVDE